jgi:glycosyltransferase involved in cell wall biosynthesis
VRILLVSAYGLPHMGGIEVAVDALASELSGRGHSVVHVSSSAGAGAESPDTSYTQIRVPALNPLEQRVGVPYPLFSPALITILRHEIRLAAVVHTHGYLYPGSVVSAALSKRGAPTPLVLTEHVGHVPYDSALLDRIEMVAVRRLGLPVLRRSDAVVTYNDRVARQLIEVCPSISQTTILNGVDTDLYHPVDEAERSRLRAGLGWDDGPRVLFVGRPVAKKGFDDAVGAIVESGISGINLVVAGSDRFSAAASERVTTLGRLSRERLAEIYRACDALIVPARGEGFPLSAQEALASGLPALIADDPGYAPNLVGIGSGARLVEAGGYAAALIGLLEDPASLSEARRSAAEHARKSFSWARAADLHESLYERLLD